MNDTQITLSDVKEFPLRTSLQNASLHLGLTISAKTFSDAGIDQKKALEMLPPIVEVPCTMQSMKAIYKSFMYARFGHTSTTQLRTNEVSIVWQMVMDEFALRWSNEIVTPFPSEEQTKAYLQSLKQ